MAGEEYGAVVRTPEKEAFSTGATRQARRGKGRFDLLSPFVLFRDAKHMENGAEAHAERNWERGIPFSRCLDAAFRHMVQRLMGDTTEDHWAAARWNLGAIMHYEEMIERGLLPASLNDLPSYERQKAEQGADDAADSMP